MRQERFCHLETRIRFVAFVSAHRPRFANTIVTIRDRKVQELTRLWQYVRPVNTSPADSKKALHTGVKASHETYPTKQRVEQSPVAPWMERAHNFIGYQRLLSCHFTLTLTEVTTAKRERMLP